MPWLLLSANGNSHNAALSALLESCHASSLPIWDPTGATKMVSRLGDEGSRDGIRMPYRDWEEHEASQSKRLSNMSLQGYLGNVVYAQNWGV